MSNLSFKFTRTSGKALHTTLDQVHYIKNITDEERAKIDAAYPDAHTSAYKASIKFFDQDQNVLAVETVEDFQSSGLALVNIGGDKMAPAHNIQFAEAFNKADKEDLEKNKKTTLTTTYRSRVTTPTGQTFLTVRHPSQLMDSKSKAVQSNSISEGQGAPAITNG